MIEPRNTPPPNSRPMPYGDWAVRAVLVLLGRVMSPEREYREIINQLSAAEILLLRRADPTWRLPATAKDAGVRMAEVERLERAARAPEGIGKSARPIPTPAPATDEPEIEAPDGDRRGALRERLKQARMNRQSADTTEVS